MSVHVGEIESDVTVIDGEMPFSEGQLDKLVEMVCKRLEKKKREEQQARAATTLTRGATPTARVSE